MFKEILNIKSTTKDLRKFGITVGSVFIGIACFLWWKGLVLYPVFMIIGIVLLGCGLIFPASLKPMYIIWMALANALGWVMTRFFLTILYYSAFTGIKVIGSLAGKSFLDVKWDVERETYWHYRQEQSKPESCEKQF